MNLHSPQTGPPRPLPGLRTPWRVLEPPQSLRPPWRMCPPPLLWMLHPLGCETVAPPGVGGSWRMARTVRSSALTPLATKGFASLSASTHSHRLRRSGPSLCPTTNPFFGRSSGVSGFGLRSVLSFCRAVLTYVVIYRQQHICNPQAYANKRLWITHVCASRLRHVYMCACVCVCM